MKKTLSAFLVVLVLVNFIFCGNVYAKTDFEGIDGIDESSVSGADQEAVINQGSVGGNSISWLTMGSEAFSSIMQNLASLVNIFPMILQELMSYTVESGQDESTEVFSIGNVLFRQLSFFDINYFDYNYSYKVGIANPERIEAHKSSKILKNYVAKFFYFMRLLAIAISLLVLIYIGIRMILASTSSNKAKYKEMFMYWIESILLLFLMHYIMVALVQVGNLLIDMAYDLKCTIEADGVINFEDSTVTKIYVCMNAKSGWTYVQYSMIYWYLVYIQVKYFYMYLKRVIVVGFLIMISPIVTVTYAIDKVGDGKAQAYSAWLSEFFINVMIQPIQAIIYIVFIYTAGEIANKSMSVAILFLFALTKVEKVVLKLFNLNNVESLKPVEDQDTKI